MSKKTDLSSQLREAIQESGRSLNQLGQEADVDAGRLSRFLRGERDLTLEAVGRLCKVLGLRFCPEANRESNGGAEQADCKPAKRTAKGK